MQGQLGGGKLAEIVQELVRSKASGLLFLRNAGQEKAVYFARGRVVNADSNVGEEGIGYHLLDHGRISPQDLQEAMRRVEPGRSLGDVLREAGHVDEAALAAACTLLAERIVVSVFDWTAGDYFFQEGDFSYKGALGLNTAAILVEGVRRLFDFDGLREKLLADPRPLRPQVGQADLPRLEPSEGFILSRIDGSLAARDICALSLLSEEMTCRVLFGLLIAGVIAHGEAARAEPRSGETGPRPRPAPSAPFARPSPGAPPPAEARAASAIRHEPAARAAAPRVEASRPAPDRSPTHPRVEAWSPPVPPPRTAPAAPPRGPSDTTGSRPRPVFQYQGELLPAQKERLEELDRLYDTLDQLNLYAVLGLGRDAPTAAVQEAWARLSERFHPAKNAWLTDEAARSRMLFVFARMKSAWQTLSTDKARIEYDEQLRRHDKEAGAEANIRMEFNKTDRQKAIDERTREGEVLFREASKLYELQRFHDARERVLKAIEVHPQEPRYFALAGRIEMKNPNLRWQKEAENHLRRAVELDSWNPDYHVLLGQVYLNSGMRQKAKREFIKALEIDPANPTALAEVPVGERPERRSPETSPPPPAEEEVDWS